MIGTIAFTSTLANQKHHHQQQNSQTDNPQHQQPKVVRSPSVLQRLKSINFYNYRFQEPNSIASQLKTAPDSDTHFDFEQTHQPQSLESHSQYIFEQPHHEKEAIFNEQVQETQTHYYFDQIQEAKTQESEAHFVFEQTQEENETGFDFQLDHEENVESGEGPEMQSLDEVYSQLSDGHVTRSKSDSKTVAGETPVRLPTKMKKSASLKSAFNHFEEEDIVDARRPATVRERGAKATKVDDEEVDAKADDFINRFKQQLKLQRLDSIIRYKEMIGRGSGR